MNASAPTYTPLTRQYNMGGWTVTIEAPEKVLRFEVVSLTLDLLDLSIQHPIHVSLKGSIDEID